MAVTTAAVVGIAAGVGSAVKGFSDASKAKNAAAKAEREAKKAMRSARSKAEVDQYAALEVPLDAYEAAFEANLAADRQAVEALQEGDSRQLAAGVGRIGAQQAAEAQQTRMAMGDEMFNLDKMKADSKEAIKQQLIGFDVGEAKMQDQKAYEAEQARKASIQQGISGITQAASSAASLAPLFPKSGGAPKSTPATGGGNTPGVGLQVPSMSSGGINLSTLNQTPSIFGQTQLQFPEFNPINFSDKRLKENIKLIGKSPSGLNIYSFKYKNKEGLYQGVMSDEINPNAVKTIDGYDMVDYSMIDVEFKQL